METSGKASEEVVRGTVKRVTYRNPQNGYSVLQLTVSGSSDALTVVGTCLETRVGSNLMARGTYSVHPMYGKQFTAYSIVEITPDTPQAIEKYLASSLIKGIGPKTAKRIVREFGADTLRAIHERPQDIGRLKGVGFHRANLLKEAIGKKEAAKEVYRYLIENDISALLAQKIYDKFKEETIEIVNRNPYRLAREIKGVGFLKADKIAKQIGIAEDSPERLKAGLLYALEQGSEDGHCCLEAQKLSDSARALLGLSPEYSLENPLHALLDEGEIVNRHGYFFLAYLDFCEKYVAEFIARRLKHKSELIPLSELSAVLEQVSQELEIKLSAEQLKALGYVFKYPLTVISGGPGCGKTTLVRAIVSVCQKRKISFLMGAPTGRAAQRMAQVCSAPASTIHRLLKYDPRARRFSHGADNPLFADLVIIDESSMIDVSLAKDLFSANGKKTHLVLVGDKDQLPSVGPGRVFGDLIGSDVIPEVTLTQLFRRSNESRINVIAHQVNSALVPDIPEPDGKIKSDAYFISKPTTDELSRTIENLISKQLPQKFSFDSDEIMVLTPSNRGPLGTIELNRKLQAVLNPERPGADSVKVGDIELRVGDRVCQRVNNYNLHDAGVFNGDLGKIVSLSAEERKLQVELWDGRLIDYGSEEIFQLSLAYAISVHRSQGSELPCVVVILHESQYNLLEKQLFYTAITRAKKLLIIVGTKKALRVASQRVVAKNRGTLLVSRIQELLLNNPLQTKE